MSEIGSIFEILGCGLFIGLEQTTLVCCQSRDFSGAL